MNTTYILADNRDITCEGITSLLHQQNKNATIVTAASYSELQEMLTRYPQSVVILCETAKPAPPKQEQNTLTATEKMVLREIALGKMTKEIAHEKNLSFHTVNTHRKNIFRKLEVNNVHEATKYALQAGLVDLVEYYI